MSPAQDGGNAVSNLLTTSSRSISITSRPGNFVIIPEETTHGDYDFFSVMYYARGSTSLTDVGALALPDRS